MKRIPLITTLILTSAIFVFSQSIVEKAPAAGSMFLGPWQANLARSQRDQNHQFESLTIKFEFSGDSVLLTYAGVNKKGNREGNTRKLYPDGKERIIPEAPGYVELSKWLGPFVLESVGMKEGTVLGRSTYEVSKDGTTLTANVKGIDANGQPFEQVIVFDRQHI